MIRHITIVIAPDPRGVNTLDTYLPFLRQYLTAVYPQTPVEVAVAHYPSQAEYSIDADTLAEENNVCFHLAEGWYRYCQERIK